MKLQNAGIHVICKTPITTLTEGCYEQIKDWCLQHGIQYYTGDELIDSYGGQSRNQYFASDKTREKVKSERREEFFSDDEMKRISVSAFSKKMSFDCAAGKGDFYLSARHILYPCVLGVNVPEWTFDITASGGIKDAYEQMSERISSYKDKPLAHCHGCVHHKVCQECFMTQYEFQGKELAEHRCQYCKQLKDFMANPIKT